MRCAARGSRPFNSLSRDHLNNVEDDVEAAIRHVAFQLPLSGSLHIIRVILILQARVLMRLTFLSTPSLGITERHFVFVGGGKCPRLSTPSLGITHGEKPDRSADRPRDFQLPLSGSPKINWGALLRQAILHFQLPLSGSLELPRIIYEAWESDVTFQLPLSGSRRVAARNPSGEDCFQLPLSGSPRIPFC